MQPNVTLRNFGAAEVELFWKRWNEVAHERELLLAANIVDWEAVKETLQMSNLLLINSPDRDI